jgi:hypothetical protein
MHGIDVCRAKSSRKPWYIRGFGYRGSKRRRRRKKKKTKKKNKTKKEVVYTDCLIGY